MRQRIFVISFVSPLLILLRSGFVALHTLVHALSMLRLPPKRHSIPPSLILLSLQSRNNTDLERHPPTRAQTRPTLLRLDQTHVLKLEVPNQLCKNGFELQDRE